MPAKDILSCSNYLNIVVGGVYGLAELDSNDLSPIENIPELDSIFKCFCEINSNLLEGCELNRGRDSYTTCSLGNVQ